MRHSIPNRPSATTPVTVVGAIAFTSAFLSFGTTGIRFSQEASAQALVIPVECGVCEPPATIEAPAAGDDSIRPRHYAMTPVLVMVRRAMIAARTRVGGLYGP